MAKRSVDRMLANATLHERAKAQDGVKKQTSKSCKKVFSYKEQSVESSGSFKISHYRWFSMNTLRYKVSQINQIEADNTIEFHSFN
jgi:hypothetical protein